MTSAEYEIAYAQRIYQERPGPEVDPGLTPLKENWNPHPIQKVALQSDADELLFGGARGGGKSDWLLADFAQFAELYGRAAVGGLFRRTMPQFRQLKAKAMEMFRGRATWHERDKEWRFKNGALLVMSFLDTVEDATNYMGFEYSWMGFDEITEWPSGEPYEFMGTCLRSPHDIPKYRRCTGNPGRSGHAWVKEYWIDKVPHGEVYFDPISRRTRQFIPSRLADNPHLMHNEDYINELMSLNPLLRKAFLLGDWSVFLGQAFPEWDQRLHTIPAHNQLGHAWRRWCGLDWGTNRPYCLLYFVANPNGHIWVVREAYGQKPNAKPNTGTHESSSEVAKREAEWAFAAGFRTVIFDPSMDNDEGHDKTLIQYWRDVGWDCIRGNNDRLSGKGAVHHWLKTPADDGYPMLQVFRTCPHLIRTLPALPYATTGIHKDEDVDKNAEAHAYDALRYPAISDFANSAMNLEGDDYDRMHEIDERESAWSVSDREWYGAGWAERGQYSHARGVLGNRR